MGKGTNIDKVPYDHTRAGDLAGKFLFRNKYESMSDRVDDQDWAEPDWPNVWVPRYTVACRVSNPRDGLTIEVTMLKGEIQIEYVIMVKEEEVVGA